MKPHFRLHTGEDEAELSPAERARRAEKAKVDAAVQAEFGAGFNPDTLTHGEREAVSRELHHDSMSPFDDPHGTHAFDVIGRLEVTEDERRERQSRPRPEAEPAATPHKLRLHEPEHEAQDDHDDVGAPIQAILRRGKRPNTLSYTEEVEARRASQANAPDAPRPA